MSETTNTTDSSATPIELPELTGSEKHDGLIREVFTHLSQVWADLKGVLPWHPDFTPASLNHIKAAADTAFTAIRHDAAEELSKVQQEAAPVEEAVEEAVNPATNTPVTPTTTGSDGNANG